MPKKQIEITAQIHNYSIPSRIEEKEDSLLLTLQAANQNIPQDFPIPTRILVPKTDENKPLLENIVKAIGVGKTVMFDGTYTCVPPHFLNYIIARALKHLLGDKRALGESAVKTFEGTIKIDNRDSYEIRYHSHKGEYTFVYLKY